MEKGGKLPIIDTQELPESEQLPALDPDFEEILNAPPPKRGPGRPPIRREAVELPPPRRFPLKDAEFFQYWKETEGIDPNRLIVYVWRTHPYIDKKALNPKAYTNIGKMEKAPEPDEWIQAMLHRWGSGNYKLMLKDEGAKKPRAIAMTYVSVNDPDYPPWIEDLNELVMDHPNNQSFIENLRQKGILPGEREMAGSEAMSILAGTVKDLSAQAAAQKKEPPAQPQTPAEVTIKTLEMAGKAFDQGVTLTKETMAAQADAKVAEAKANLAGTQQNPTQAIGFIKELAEVIQKLQPPAAAALTMPAPNSGDMLKELTGIFTTFMDREAKLQGTILTLQSTRMETLEKQLQALMLNPATPAAQKESLSTSLDTLIGMKDKLETLFGSKGEAEDSQAPVKLPGWVHALQTVASVIPNAMAAGVAMTHNLAVARTGQGAPISAGTVESETPPLLPNPTPQPTSTAQDGAGVIPPEAMDFLNEIREPFLRYLNDPEKTGVEFAQLVKNYLGDIKYQGAREAGKDTLLILLRLYPPTAAVVKSIPERTAEFVDDFVNAEEILAAEDADEDGQEQPGNVRTFVAPAEGAAEVLDVPPVVLNQEAARKKREKAGV